MAGGSNQIEGGLTQTILQKIGLICCVQGSRLYRYPIPGYTLIKGHLLHDQGFRRDSLKIPAGKDQPRLGEEAAEPHPFQ